MHLGDCFAGRLVTYRGDLAKIEKKGTRYVVIVLENGNRYKVLPPYLEPAPSGAVFSPISGEATGLYKGSIVRYKKDHKYYVIVHQNGHTYSMARLGGDAGRYITGVSSTTLENVDFNLEED